MEFQVFSPNTVVTARNRDRSRFAAWGVRGGRAGTPSRFTRNAGRTDAEELGNSDLVKLEPGDSLRIQGPGAGGYGAPYERDVALVLRDVRGGFVSRESALAFYGVVLNGLEIDEAATRAARAEMRAMPNGHHFDLGPGRVAFDAVMTPARYDVLTRLLAALPVSWRFYVKHRVFDAMFAEGADFIGDETAIQDIFTAISDRFPELALARIG